MAPDSYKPPPVMVKPKYEVATRHPKIQITDIVFDIEATGLYYSKEDILSIAAVTAEGEKVIEEFIFPVKRKKIPKKITEMTGLEIKSSNGEDCMFLDGKPVKAVSLETALKNFIDVLKAHAKDGEENKKGDKNNVKEGKINLMAHNCFGLDVLILCEALELHNLLEDFASVVISVTDTLELFEKAFPNSRYKLKDLAHDQGVLSDKFVAHTALEDAKILAKLLSKVSKRDLVDSCTYTWASIPPRVQYLNKKQELFRSLHCLVREKVISRNMADRIAGTGIGFADLEAAFTHSKMDGLTKLLSDKGDGKIPRVTCHKPIINALFVYFCSRIGNGDSNKTSKSGKKISLQTDTGALEVPHSEAPHDPREKPDAKKTCIGQLHKLDSELKEAKRRLHDLELEVRTKFEDHDQHRCMNSVRLFGIDEKPKESIENVVMHVLQSLVKVSCSVNDIDFCHRIGRFQRGSCRPILVQFSSYRTKWQVLNNKYNLKGTKIIVCEELTEKRLKLYYAVRDEVGERNAWTRDGRILARKREGRICCIQSINDLQYL